MYKKVVLIHGYCRTQRDMVDLKKNLDTIGYEGILIDLPLTFRDIEYAYSVFEEKINIIILELEENERINLVGHSTGGLIIRLFLNRTRYKHKIHRCVLIATPNKGSQLADWACRVSDIFVNIFKTLKSLTEEHIDNLKLVYREDIDIGVIAGNKNKMILGKLMKVENDGRVEVDSVRYVGSKDFIILPYGHKEIHHHMETASLIGIFLKDGRFKS